MLLASDLSHRCDRALGRAALLAGAWRAELVALHVLDKTSGFFEERRAIGAASWGRRSDCLSLAARALQDDVLEHVPWAEAIIAKGDPDKTILSAARHRGVDLVLTGAPWSETSGWRSSGTTTRSLIRNADVPVLVVKRKPRRAYRTIVVPTDFSEASRNALSTALTLFPDGNVIAFHAVQLPREAPRNEDSLMQVREAGIRQARAFLNERGLVRESDAARVRVVVEHGHPVWLLRDYVVAKDVDLVVSATQKRNAMIEMIVGNYTFQFLDVVPCDLMAVRQPA